MTAPASLTVYRCRALSKLHAISLHALLHPWVQAFDMRGGRLPELEGDRLVFHEVDVEFTLMNEGPRFEEILWLVDEIDETEVITSTLAQANEYTGKRRRRSFHDAPARRPRREIMAVVNSEVYDNYSRLVAEMVEREVTSSLKYGRGAST